MADPQERSTPGLMADLLDQVTQLVRKEVQLFRAEMSDKATQAMVAAGSILAAAGGRDHRAERLWPRLSLPHSRTPAFPGPGRR